MLDVSSNTINMAEVETLECMRIYLHDHETKAGCQLLSLPQIGGGWLHHNGGMRCVATRTRMKRMESPSTGSHWNGF